MLKKTAPKVSAAQQLKADSAALQAAVEQINLRPSTLPVRTQKNFFSHCASKKMKPLDAVRAILIDTLDGVSAAARDAKLDAIGAKLDERERIDREFIAAMDRNTDSNNQLASAVRRIDIDAANRAQASDAKAQEHLSRFAAEIRGEIAQVGDKVADGVGRIVGQSFNRLSVDQANWATRIEQALSQIPSRQPTDARDVRDALALHNQKTEEALNALAAKLTAELQSAVSGMWAQCIQAATASGYELQPAQLESMTNHVTADVSRSVVAGLETILNQKRQSKPTPSTTSGAAR
ncbi:hypothetical protein BX589_10154 [Paraburkholderia fungorum]|jgi:hypothetical protein|nr:hypothetical protein BX589_10154 [Paraburkholderia fungorum]